MTLARTRRLTLLDGFTLRLGPGQGDAVLQGLPRGVQRLVAHLGLAGRPARTAIAGQLWPDVPEDHAQGSLRSALWRLQKAAPGLVESHDGALSLARDTCVDVRELTEWAGRVLDPLTPPGVVPPPDLGQRGELLPGWYDDWVLLERERLRQLRMHALEALAVKLVAAGRYGEALQAAHTAVRAEPLRESAHRVVVQAHLAEGNVTEAVRTYEAFRALVAAELGVLPTAQMRALLRGALPERRTCGGRYAGRDAVVTGAR